ncbi:hypothetical protein BZ21_745 [Yersinia pseudotuberculosis]|uniref:hypothetical protein n=1 Tax=Yersinia pseudotuberculosis TaxID=633 RepID=UPI0005AD333E|nr:hypothetical protein [Yersinia pseudotuberculosis]AJJ03363.1 hypothetical protein BZ21_745 [Yersinia pseudotuberculosis]AXY32640.1 hypothetical protein CEQ20_03905 [Yersinia pseudotuberculosis]MBO1550235.1 hypothetical protein [Yersinia pseudotuberculosis]MBO1570361.1 hypothetical protein [Yersinia pseudotuberculosis]MBO1585359.1 hypothetical protein [Yersinia pseudotuberculosis]
MLRKTQKRHELAYITLPDGRTGTIHTDRRCDVNYDFPVDVRISGTPPQEVTEKLILLNQK